MSVTEPVERAGGTTSGIRWAWLMLPAFGLVLILTNVAYPWVLEARGQREGDLLAMTEDFAGVALETSFALLLLAPAVVGVVLAVRALRHHAAGGARAAVAVNGLLVLLVLYQLADALRMSFFAPLD